jgi:hypothetical protein
MNIDNPKVELSYLAHLSCSVILKSINDYRNLIKKKSVRNHFMLIRQKIDNVHGRDAIEWFYDRDDSALSFPVCCFIIERALANKTAVAKALSHKKSGLLFDPEILREKIFADPAAFAKIFKELAKKMSAEDVRADFVTDSGIDSFQDKGKQGNSIPSEIDIDFLPPDVDADIEFETKISAVG